MIKSEAFDNFALEYDEWFEKHPLDFELELRAIQALLPEEGRGIEIGAGTGRFSYSLGISLGVEPSQAMRDIAIRRGVNMVAGTAESLPVGVDLYDYALLVTTLCFFDNPKIGLKEVYRVLKPSGFIIVGFIDRESKLGIKYEETKNKSKFYKDANFHTVDEVQSDLKEVGFCNFRFAQAVLSGDKDENLEPDVKSGHGEGSFIVVRAQK